MLDPYAIREDFPILNKILPNGKKLVYLDNAATTQKPRQVLEAILRFYREYNGNIGRGGHYLGREATRIFEEAHEEVARLLNARSWEEIVLTRNTTSAINLLAPPLVEKCLREGRKKIVLTKMEHGSNMLPWLTVAEKLGARVEFVNVLPNGALDMEDYEEKVDEETGIVAFTHMSNVTGIVNPVREMTRIAHRVGALVFLDGAQSVPHTRVNVRQLEVDFLAFSGHKMLAPLGTGALYGRKDLLEQLSPWETGGGAAKVMPDGSVKLSSLPMRFEPGTPDAAGAAGLIEAIRYLERIGFDNISEHERRLTGIVLKGLEQYEDHVIIYSPREDHVRTGIVTFNLKGARPGDVGRLLDSEYGIAVRTGYHCAALYHQCIGAPQGSVRASFYIYNTKEEAEYLVQALVELIEKKPFQE